MPLNNPDIINSLQSEGVYILKTELIICDACIRHVRKMSKINYYDHSIKYFLICSPQYYYIYLVIICMIQIVSLLCL